MCKIDIEQKVGEIAKDIKEQVTVVSEIAGQVEEMEGNKLFMNDEWACFEKTAYMKRFIDEEIVLLDLRMKRMDLQMDGILKG